MRAHAKWEIENRTFNTLKNQGYYFGYNFGLGKKHVSEVFVLLMMQFRSMVIDQDLVIKANGAQRIMWSELGDAWDALEPDFVNFTPKAAE